MGAVDGVDLKEKCDRLRSIGKSRPNILTHNEVEEALYSKWQGVQSVAAQVLGEWGDKKSKGTLVDYLLKYENQSYGFRINSVVIKSLIPCVTEKDSEWILDTYFSKKKTIDQHDYFHLALALPQGSIRSRLVKELKSDEMVNRFGAVKLLGNCTFDDRSQLLNRMSADESDQVRSCARLHLER